MIDSYNHKQSQLKKSFSDTGIEPSNARRVKLSTAGGILYYCPFQRGTSNLLACFDVSFCTVSPFVCLHDIKLGLGS